MAGEHFKLPNLVYQVPSHPPSTALHGHVSNQSCVTDIFILLRVSFAVRHFYIFISSSCLYYDKGTVKKTIKTLLWSSQY